MKAKLSLCVIKDRNSGILKRKCFSYLSCCPVAFSSFPLWHIKTTTACIPCMGRKFNFCGAFCFFVGGAEKSQRVHRVILLEPFMDPFEPHKCRRCKFLFRKRSLPFETVNAISQNGRCHFSQLSLPFETLDVISHDGRCQEGTDISDSLQRPA